MVRTMSEEKEYVMRFTKDNLPESCDKCELYKNWPQPECYICNKDEDIKKCAREINSIMNKRDGFDEQFNPQA